MAIACWSGKANTTELAMRWLQHPLPATELPLFPRTGNRPRLDTHQNHEAGGPDVSRRIPVAIVIDL